MRLDNFIAELTKTSRTKTNELIEEGRVFVNYEDVYKSSKFVKEGDILTVRGKGKFIIKNMVNLIHLKGNLIQLVFVLKTT